MNIILCLLITGLVIFGGISVISAYTISDKDNIACDGLPTILGCHNEDYLAFGYHEDKNIRYEDDPKLSIQDSKANIIWQSRNQNIDSLIIFTQVVDGKQTIPPKTISEGENIGNGIIVSEGQKIFVVYEDYFHNHVKPSLFKITTSTDDGLNFTESKQIFTDENVHYDVNEVKLVNEKIYIFGTLWTKSEKISYLYYTVSDDFGKTFSEPTKIFNQGNTREHFTTTVSNDIIYLLFDDEKDFNEKGHLYLIKILPDGTLTEKVSVNDAKTSVSSSKLVVSENDVYVMWQDRPNDDRYFVTFSASHDGGLTFEKSKHLPTDPKAIDEYSKDGAGIFVIDNTLYVLWISDYWDGKTQTMITFLGTSENKGKDFKVEEIPISTATKPYGYVFLVIDDDKQYYFTPGIKNYPYENAAIYFNVKDKSGNYSEIVDMLQDYQLGRSGFVGDVDGGFIHLALDGDFQTNCMLYQLSSDDGKNFNDIINLSDQKTDEECLISIPNIESPSKQFTNGIEKNNVQCRSEMNDDRILFLTKNDGKPVCILSNHYYDLTKRGYLAEDSFTKLAILSSEQFLQSVLSEKYDANIQNLKLSYNGQRDSLPPLVSLGGTFETDKQLYPTENTDDYKYTVSIGINSVNHVSRVTIDNNWDLFEQKPVDSVIQKPLEKSATKEHTILTLEDPINKRGLLPVAVTEVKTNVNGKVIWDRFPIRDDGDKNRIDWGSLPHDSGAWTFVDEDGNDAWDNSVIPYDQFGINLPGISWIAICDDKRIVKAGGVSPTVPILPEVETVYMTQKSIGIFPSSEGKYHLEFISLYETVVNLPSNATNVSIDSIICKHEAPANLADYAFVTTIDFSLKD